MTFDLLGISISFIGTIVLAFSISKNPGNAHQFIDGKKKYLTIIHLVAFKCGVVLIAIGFAIQILDKLLNTTI